MREGSDPTGEMKREQDATADDRKRAATDQSKCVDSVASQGPGDQDGCRDTHSVCRDDERVRVAEFDQDCRGG